MENKIYLIRFLSLFSLLFLCRFQDSFGQAVGKSEVSTITDCECEVPYYDSNHNVPGAVFIKDIPFVGNIKRWTNGKIYYRWGENISLDDKTKIDNDIRIWEHAVNTAEYNIYPFDVLSIKYDSNKTSNYYVIIDVTENVNYTDLGMPNGKSKMTVSNVTSSILHEFGHVLGMGHPFQRKDRNDYVLQIYYYIGWGVYIPILLNDVVTYFIRYSPNPFLKVTKDIIYDKLLADSKVYPQRKYGSYDFRSIMHDTYYDFVKFDRLKLSKPRYFIQFRSNINEGIKMKI